MSWPLVASWQAETGDHTWNMLLADMGAPLVGDSNMYTMVHQLQHQ